MSRNDFVCSIDLGVCGRGCEANPHNCPAKLDKVLRRGHQVLIYKGDGRSGAVMGAREYEKTVEKQKTETEEE